MNNISTVVIMDKFDCGLNCAEKIRKLLNNKLELEQENEILREKVDLYKSLNRAMKMGEYSDE